MTLIREKKDTIWNCVKREFDIDDMIFGSEFHIHVPAETISDR